WRDAVEELANYIQSSVSASSAHARTRTGKRSRTDAHDLTKDKCLYLAWSIILVALRLRDAVLVDEARVTPAQQAAILDALQTWPSGSSLLSKDICFMQHRPTAQLFVFSRTHTTQRAKEYLGRSSASPSPPWLALVCADKPVGTTPAQPGRQLHAAIKCLSGLPTSPPGAAARYELTSSPQAAVGIAGWLLGYPCIYHFEAEDSIISRSQEVSLVEHSEWSTDHSADACEDQDWDEPTANNLGGSPLWLYQAALVSPSLGESSGTETALLSFTIPEAVMDRLIYQSVPRLDASNVQAHLADDLEQRRTEALERLDKLIAELEVEASTPLRRLQHTLDASRVRVALSQVTLPLVAL
ncbi:hypothetical protein V8E36_008953, partial [Tilletia maclaganii]